MSGFDVLEKLAEESAELEDRIDELTATKMFIKTCLFRRKKVARPYRGYNDKLFRPHEMVKFYNTWAKNNYYPMLHENGDALVQFFKRHGVVTKKCRWKGEYFPSGHQKQFWAYKGWVVKMDKLGPSCNINEWELEEFERPFRFREGEYKRSNWLSELQKTEICKKILAGQSQASLADEYKVQRMKINRVWQQYQEFVVTKKRREQFKNTVDEMLINSAELQPQAAELQPDQF